MLTFTNTTTREKMEGKTIKDIAARALDMSIAAKKEEKWQEDGVAKSLRRIIAVRYLPKYGPNREHIGSNWRADLVFPSREGRPNRSRGLVKQFVSQV